MSVQVRSRRESAAFLSSFVGAQGELLVDTTNNRVQVHDGAAPGGWPAAGIGDLTSRNIVINGTFAINQRGYASGISLAAGAYAHDRWKAGAGGCTYTFTQAVPDTTITITAGTLVQAIDPQNVYATDVWLTWRGTAQVRVWQGSAGAFVTGTTATVGGVVVNALRVTGLSVGVPTNVEFAAGTVGLVQLEAALPNAGPTRFERRFVGHETALCQRYYNRITFVPNGVVNDQYCGSAQSLLFSYAIPTMRVLPTITITGVSWSNGSSIGAYGTPNWILVFGSASAAGRVYAITASSGGFFELNAEI